VTVETRAKSVTFVRIVCVAPNSNVGISAVVSDTAGAVVSCSANVAWLPAFRVFEELSVAVISMR